MSENKNAKTPADDGQPVAWMHNFIENNVITHIPADIAVTLTDGLRFTKTQLPAKRAKHLLWQ